MANPKITFIGAGSAVFMKNIVGDILQRPALAGATIRLMDINPTRLEESEVIARKLIATLGVSAMVWRRLYFLGTSKSMTLEGS